MSFSPVGDLARHLLLQRHTSQTKAELNRLTEMMASGRHPDPAAIHRGDLGPLTALDNSLGKLEAWRLAADGRTLQMDAMQGALTAIGTLGRSTAEAFSLAVQPTQITAAARSAFSALEALLDHLNTRVAGQWVFSGTASDHQAVADAETLLTALQPALAGLTTPSEVEAGILAWMSDPGGFETAVYRGGPTALAIALSPEDRFSHGITATDPGLARVMAGLAMGALLDRGLFAGSENDRARAGTLSAEILLTSTDDSIGLAARLGQAQAQMARISTRNAAERSMLEIERSRMTSADPERTAAELTQASDQLELLHAMTARLTSLSLLNFLR